MVRTSSVASSRKRRRRPKASRCAMGVEYNHAVHSLDDTQETLGGSTAKSAEERQGVAAGERYGRSQLPKRGARERTLSSFLLLLVLALSLSYPNAVRGFVATESGYDTIGGYEAICWRTIVSASAGTENQPSLPLSLLDGNRTASEMLLSCPGATNLRLEVKETDLLRSEERYTYHVQLTLDLAAIVAETNRSSVSSSWELTSAGNGTVLSARMVFCPIGSFCSPFLPVAPQHVLDGEAFVGLEEHHDEDHHHRFILETPLDSPHVYASNYVLIDNATVQEWLEGTAAAGLIDFHLDFQLGVPVRGHIVPMASLHFLVQSASDQADGSSSNESVLLTYRYDVANLLSDRTLLFSSPTDILAIAPAMAILSYVVISITGFVQLVLLCGTIYYRNEGVMKLSQGGFLILLQAAGLTATVSSFLYDGSSNAACFLQAPLVLIPIQLMLAIVFGRLRRIIRIMSPLMEWDETDMTERDSTSDSISAARRLQRVKHGLKTWKTFMSDIYGRTGTAGTSHNSDSHSQSSRPASLGGDDPSGRGSASSVEGDHMRDYRRRGLRRDRFATVMKESRRRIMGLRQTFTAAQLWVLLILVTLPIVIVVVVGLTVFPPYRTLTLNDDQSVGRYECGTTNDQIYQLASTGLVVATMFLVLYEAHRSRRLPALFNEVEQVSSALLISLFIAVLAFAVIIITEDPTTSPGIPYIMKVILVCLVSVNTSGRLIVPKLRLIWRGEKVVISKILADHRRSQTGRTLREFQQESHGYGMSLGTGVVDGLGAAGLSHTAPSDSSEPEEEEDTFDMDPNNSFTPSALGSARGSSLAIVSEIAEKVDCQSNERADGGPNGDTENGAGDEEAESHRRISFASEDVERSSSRSLTHRPPPSLGLQPMLSCPVLTRPSPGVTPASSRRLIVVEGKTPPSKLMIAILGHSKMISHINERILSGLQVSKRNWEDLKTSVEDLERLLDTIEYG